MLRKRKVRTFSTNHSLVLQKRKSIAEKSVLVFLRYGYEKTTMRDLGKALKMASGSIYHYIGSKKDILHLICLNTALGAQPIRDHVAKLGDISITEVLIKAITFNFERADSVADTLLFFNRAILNFSRDDYHHLLSSEIDVISYFETIIKDGVQAGEFRFDDTIILAHDITMYGNDWALRKWFLKQHYTLEEYTKKHIQMALALLKANLTV